MNELLKRCAGALFADLGRASLSTAQRVIMERLVRVTLVRGRQAVRIPRLEVFERFRLPKGKVSMALNGFWQPNEQAADRRWVAGLVEMGLVQVAAHPDGGWLVTVLPDATQWRCEWRFGREADEAFLADVSAEEQADLIPKEPDLCEALAVVSAERAGSQMGNEAVPEWGTGRDSLNVQRSKPCTSKAFNVERSSSGSDEEALLARCRALFGEDVMRQYGGGWRNRARADAELLERVLNETENAVKEGRVRRTPAAFAWDTWQRWAG